MKIQTKLIMWWAIICAISIAGCIAVKVTFGQGIIERAGEPPVCCAECDEAIASLTKQLNEMRAALEAHGHPHTHPHTHASCDKLWPPK